MLEKVRTRAQEEQKEWGQAKRTLCIDFDGVIHRYSKGWFNGRVYDPPMEGALESMVALEEAGYTLVVLTSRNNTIPRVKEWLKALDFGHLEVTNVKPPALAYIDDRAIRFTNWKDIRNFFT